MVVGIFFLIGLSLFFVYMSIMLMGKQGETASRAVREQLIPWVERSSLEQTDRRVIVERLEELSEEMGREELTSRQLDRLKLRLFESTILQWGTVETLNRIAQSSELSDQEKSEFSLACDRWLHAASLGHLHMRDMEFGTQNVCMIEPKSGRLVPRQEITEEMLREFMRRINSMSDKFQIPKEEFTKSVSQVFLQIVEDGLSVK